jgi:O-antigen ligase
MTRRLEDGPGAGRRGLPGPQTVAAVLLGLLVAVVALPYDGRVFAMYYTPRVALFTPVLLVTTLVVLWGARRAGRPTFDLLDLLLAAFVAWQLVAAALAPVWTLAWFGAYNRTGGAVYLVALALVLVLARRTLVSRTAVEAFAWVTGATVAVASAVALVQAAGGTTPWRFDDIWVGRMPGTTGNPLDLAGLCLLGVWLGAVAAGLPALPRRVRWMAGVASALALAGVVISVSRAAYLGLAAALLLLALAALRRRPRALALLAGVTVVLAAGTLLYDPAGSGSGALSSRVSTNLAASTYGLTVDGLSRGTFWRAGLAGVEERPLTGWGPGGYVVAYRRHVPGDVLVSSPLSSVTDPHDLPLLLATGSGIPGLALALAVGMVAALRAAPALRRSLGRRPGTTQAVGGDGDAGLLAPDLVLAACACALALACFLSFSPADPSATVPLVLMLGMMAGAPGPLRRGAPAAEAPERSAPTWRLARGLAMVATGALLVTAVVLATRLYSADLALRSALVQSDRAAAVHASKTMPWVPVYGLVAGAMTVRAAAADLDQSRFDEGRRPLAGSAAADPSAAAARIELARLDLTFLRFDDAMREIQAGLEWNPGNPVLLGLWGYTAQSAARRSASRRLGESLTRRLQAYPRKNADAWYWLAGALEAVGEGGLAKEALAEASRSAPGLGQADYEERLRGVL